MEEIELVEGEDDFFDMFETTRKWFYEEEIDNE